MSDVRVRFAPSPTGWLHIGGVRTALFNFLYARKLGGKFLLRIEDTDLDRSEQKYTDDILSSLAWLGLKHDRTSDQEDILYQSKREAIYTRVAEDLISKDLAYRCYCTEEEVNASREQMMKDGVKAMYARTCRDKKYGVNGVPAPAGRTSYAIRAKFPLTGTTAFQDMIRGEISFPNEDIDDFVLIRSNKVPTYNFVVVIDDLEMKISHVIRGDDHINNTPKQIFLYDAMKAPVPLFAHLPMILGQDKKKLSKRNNETSTNAYRSEGYLPEALLNFLVRLGWSHGDQELFTMDEMIQLFGFDHVSVAGGVFNTEKLMWVQAEHMKTVDPARLLKILKEDFKFSSNADEAYVVALLSFLKVKAKLIKELPDQLGSLCESGVVKVDDSALKWNKDPAQKAKIKEAIAQLLKDWSSAIGGKKTLSLAGVGHAEVDAKLRAIGEQFGLKLGDLTQPMRLYVTGQPNSSIGLFDLLPIMPWETVKVRLEAAIGV